MSQPANATSTIIPCLRYRNALAMIEIDSQGLDEMDKRLLEVLIYKFNGGPVGLNSLAVAVGEAAPTCRGNSLRGRNCGCNR